MGFQKSHFQKSTQGCKGGKTKGSNFKPNKFQGSKSTQGQGKSWLETLNVSTPRVSILNITVNPTPVSTQVSAQKQHLKVLIGQLNLTITSPMLTGRLAQFIVNWEKITQDRWALQARGYKVDSPWQISPIPAFSCSLEEVEMISTEVRELLAKGAVIKTPPTQQGFVSQIFLV